MSASAEEEAQGFRGIKASDVAFDTAVSGMLAPDLQKGKHWPYSGGTGHRNTKAGTNGERVTVSGESLRVLLYLQRLRVTEWEVEVAGAAANDRQWLVGV